jgi:His-Xaa-Ser system protein HxsD
MIGEVTFPREGHSVDAIERAAYRLSDRLCLELSNEDDFHVCRLHTAGEAEVDADALVAEFRNEVLDQVLRERIRNETQEARNLILAVAFSGTGLVDGE